LLVDEEQERRRARAAGRAGWPIRRHRLDEEPDEDLSATTTAEERLGMVWQLTLAAWASAGLPIPDYPRDQAPGRVLRWPPGNGE
jgi:hypothetical protein